MSLIRWIKRIWGLLLALAAPFGVQAGQPLPLPLPVTPPTVAPVPAPPAKKVIGQCATGQGVRADGSTGFYATCVVDGRSFTLPGDFGSRALAQQAIRDFREANV
jgi:hypothetical protein